MNRDVAKRAAANAAVALVEDGMTVGLGTGSTAAMFVNALAERVQQDKLREVTCVATSESVAGRAITMGLRVVDLINEIDLAVDGADEVAFPDLRLIKGLGGALVREKIVAEAARRFIIIVDSGKLVDRLGTHVPLPVEIIAFGAEQTCRRILSLGVGARFRSLPEGGKVISDNGNPIVDCYIGPERDVAWTNDLIRAMAGVIETGYFDTEIERVIVGDCSGTVKQLIAPAKKMVCRDVN